MIFPLDCGTLLFDPDVFPSSAVKASLFSGLICFAFTKPILLLMNNCSTAPPNTPHLFRHITRVAVPSTDCFLSVQVMDEQFCADSRYESVCGVEPQHHSTLCSKCEMRTTLSGVKHEHVFVCRWVRLTGQAKALPASAQHHWGWLRLYRGWSHSGNYKVP